MHLTTKDHRNNTEMASSNFNRVYIIPQRLISEQRAGERNNWRIYIIIYNFIYMYIYIYIKHLNRNCCPQLALIIYYILHLSN